MTNPQVNITSDLRTYQRPNDPPESIALELLLKLRQIKASGSLVAETTGDTAIGRAVELALGIYQNPSKTPDYKGIEIKSKRGNRRSKTRSTLFAQVPDWNISNLKSSGEIIDTYGYERNGDLRLYCTISTQNYNSQGLGFEIRDNILVEVDNINNVDVASWPMELLCDRLLSKHKETFWVTANTKIVNNREHFILESIIHTQNPNFDQFLALLNQGFITMDHLIKRKGGISHAYEKGPLFKIKPEYLSTLFPEPVEYSLD